MRYLYMNNYRGFSDTIIRIPDVAFFVGENSTGKSSVLSLLNLFSKPNLWFGQESSAFNDSDLGSFKDIASAKNKNLRTFEIGIISVTKGDSPESPENDRISYNIFSFKNESGTPRVKTFLGRQNNQIYLIKLQGNHKKKFLIAEEDFNRNYFDEGFEEHLRAEFQNYLTKESGFKKFPDTASVSMPIGVLLSALESMSDAENESFNPLRTTIPIIISNAWIAPIRSQPQRFYDGLQQDFSPEGKHTPFILKQSLKAKTKSAAFVNKLKNFGTTSGLFESVTAHSFSNAPQSPFEIVVKFSGSNFNIQNVGYGVSQALPLVVEFLARRTSTQFVVQQPEVHLHPRAQAALGSLVFELSLDSADTAHKFALETHSEYLINRFRIERNAAKSDTPASILFFERSESGNQISEIEIDRNGKLLNAPDGYNDFFIKEEFDLLEI